MGSDEYGIKSLYRDLIRMRRNMGGVTKGLSGYFTNVHHVNNGSKVIGYHRWANGGAGDDVMSIRGELTYRTRMALAADSVALVELITYRRKGHAEHDNQSYVPAGEIEKWAAENDPIDRYVQVLRSTLGVTDAEIAAIDARIMREIDEATDLAELSGTPDAREALMGVYAEPPAEQPLWFRRDVVADAYGQERPESWGTWNADGAKP